MKVLVTGADGFIGRHVVPLLEAAGHEVAALGARSNGGIDLRLAPPPVIPDLDAIVHLAGHSDVQGSIEAPRACLNDNVGGLLTVLDYARVRPGVRVVVLSTDEAEKPRNPYGASKAAQEALSSAYRATYGVETVVARADLVVGPGQPAHKFLPAVSRAILAGDEVEVFTAGGEVGRRAWLGVMCAADAIRFVVETERVPEMVHLGGELLSNLSVAALVAGILDRHLRSRFVERPDVRAQPTRRLQRLEELGWSPPVPLAAELFRALGVEVMT